MTALTNKFPLEVETGFYFIVGLVVWTFVCTKWVTIIKDKSNMNKFIFICIFHRKQVSASALITSDN